MSLDSDTLPGPAGRVALGELLLESLFQFPVLMHDELLTVVTGHRLWGRGLSALDAHLLGSAALVPGARVWTRDRRLRSACHDASIACLQEPRA